jgi:GTP-binding protein
MELGPTGASGGNGGSVFCVGVADIGALTRWRNSKEAFAQDGEPGGGQYRDGKDGDDMEFSVPVGTVIHNITLGTQEEITAIGQRIRLARGGRGGRGNFHFRSSTNTSPRTSQDGTAGQEFEIRLELKLIADVGLIGLPNAGKSTLLNTITRAQQKVANYPFTTLEPNLGVLYGNSGYTRVVLADIPGLIEGASEGKGLGHKFLKHIEKVSLLLHCISSESDDPFRDYKQIRAELGAYNPALLEKKELIVFTKSDLWTDPKKDEKRLLSALKSIKHDKICVSIADDDSLRTLAEMIVSALKK